MDELSQYFLIFILAATPWIEIFLVIPGGVAIGLRPVWVAIIAFAGNVLPVFVIVYGYKHWQKWRQSRSGADSVSMTRRRQRVQYIWNKYGLPGLALSGPLITGIHLATIIALAFKPSKKYLLFWMSFSLVAWSAGMTVASFYGLEVIRSGIKYFSGLMIQCISNELNSCFPLSFPVA